MKITPEIEEMSEAICARVCDRTGDEYRDAVDETSQFLAKIIAEERAKVWEEAAGMAFLFAHGPVLNSPHHDESAKLVDDLKDRAAAERKEAGDE